MRPQWLRFWTDHTHGFDYGNLRDTPKERRRLVLRSLERSGFGWQIVFVAGFGFLADAYDIFSINTILPMLSIVYWENDMPTRYRLGLNLAMLIGSMLGQVSLGYLADRLGRRRVYGLELGFTIIASLGLATASTGVFNSMSLIGLLIFWRLVMGIGVGADYPLSSVITSEFAPAKHRDTMLAAVFFCQPFGQLIAVLVAFATTAGFRSHIANITAISGANSCSIVAADLAAIQCARTIDRAWRLIAGIGAVPAIIAIYFRFTIPESVYYSLDVSNDGKRAMSDKRYFDSMVTLEMDCLDGVNGSCIDNGQHDHSDTQTPLPTSSQHQWEATSPNLESTYTNGTVHQIENDPALQGSNKRQGFISLFFAYLSRDQNWVDLFATSINWMLLDFTFYLLGVNSSSFVPTLFGQDNRSDRPPYSLLIEEERHIMQSSTVGSLVGSLCAIALFHFKCAIPFLKGINSPRRLQTWGFVALGAFFIIVGALYMTLPTTHAYVAIVIFYQLCNLFYNLGPNTTTFIIPAQVFPTEFRCTCYGIAAASGKLGSVLGQIVVTEVMGHKALGATMIGFTVVMLAGAGLSLLITPETCDIKGESLSLDDLAERKSRQAEIKRKNERHVD